MRRLYKNYVLGEVTMISRHPIDAKLFQTYNLFIRRLPRGKVTREHIEDTFDVQDFDMFHKGDETVVALNIDEEYAVKLFESLNGKVLDFNGAWYPLEVLYLKNRMTMMRTEIVPVKDVRVQCERGCLFVMSLSVFFLVWLLMSLSM